MGEEGVDRVCSFCGSIHPDDMSRVCGVMDGVENYLVWSDSGKKIYLHRKRVMNSKEGAIKFYYHHLPESKLIKKHVVCMINVASRKSNQGEKIRYERARNKVIEQARNLTQEICDG